MTDSLPARVPELIEIKPDERGVPRMWIDGELFPWGTVSGYTLGEISRKMLPSVNVSIGAMRVTVDHGFLRQHARKQIAVIAGDWPEYAEWCRERDLDPRRGLAFYARADTLQGRSGVEVVRTGSWQERPDLAEIEELLKVVNRVP